MLSAAEVDVGEILQKIPPGIWIFAVAVFVVYAIVIGMSGNRPSRRGSGSSMAQAERDSAGVWATRKDLRHLLRRSGNDPDPRRQRLGSMLSGKHEQVMSEPLGSVMLIAPTRSGKSARYVIPDVLEHDGPQLITSVKTDIKELTESAVRKRGPVRTFDPSQSSGPTCRWSPLASVREWADALNAAKWLQESSKVEKRGVEDREFWDTNARKVLAPLLLLAARTGAGMRDVVTWASQVASMESQLGSAIAELNVSEAEDYWVSYRYLAEKTKSSVIGTLFTVLEAWAHPQVADAVDVSQPGNDVLSVGELMDQNGTLYLIAPASQQALFTPIYETLTNAVNMEVERRYAATGQPIDPPLHLCLDEAANIAPLRNLDKIASAGAGIGIKLKSVWQDEGQIVDIYGPEKARTIMSNHVNKVYFPGITDHETLRRLSDLIGRSVVDRGSQSVDSTGRVNRSEHHVEITVAPPSWLRMLPEGETIVISRNLPPMHLYATPWYSDQHMRKQIPSAVAKRFDSYYAPRQQRKKLHSVSDIAPNDSFQPTLNDLSGTKEPS